MKCISVSRSPGAGIPSTPTTLPHVGCGGRRGPIDPDLHMVSAGGHTPRLEVNMGRGAPTSSPLLSFLSDLPRPRWASAMLDVR